MKGSDRLSWLVLTFGGSGAAPKAPGTFGSLAAVAVTGVLWAVGVHQVWVLPALALGIAILHTIVGDRIVTVFGTHDPGAVVSDEACGQWLALAAAPLLGTLGSTPSMLLSLAVGFGLFRLFDITKVLGVGRAEKLPGKWGVLLDDVVAGIYAGLVFWALAAAGLFAAVTSNT